MNDAQAARVVKFMARTFREEVDELLLEAWFECCLHSVDYDQGMELARELVSTSEYMPRPAHFNELVRRDRKPLPPERHWLDDDDSPLGDNPLTTPEQAKLNIAKLRELLRGVGNGPQTNHPGATWTPPSTPSSVRRASQSPRMGKDSQEVNSEAV